MQRGQIVFFCFCFNTKIQSYHTSPSQIFTFHIRTKIRGKVEEKRLGVGRWGGRERKIHFRCSKRFTRPVTFSHLSSHATGPDGELWPVEEPSGCTGGCVHADKTISNGNTTGDSAALTNVQLIFHHYKFPLIHSEEEGVSGIALIYPALSELCKNS